MVWMSDGRAAVLCLLCSLGLFILFWFSMCFRYIVYSYISPSLFLSCSFASFCSPSKSHKVSLFLCSSSSSSHSEAVSHGEQQASVGAGHLEFALASAARSQPKSSHVPLHVCVRLSLCLSCGCTAPGMVKIFTQLWNAPGDAPRAPSEQSRNPFQPWEPEATLCTNPALEGQPVHRLGSFCLNLMCKGLQEKCNFK